MKQGYVKSVLCILIVLALSFSACSSKSGETGREASSFSGKTVAMTQGTSYASNLESSEEYSGCEIISTSSMADSLALLFKGKADYVVTDRINAQAVCDKYNQAKMTDIVLSHEYYGFAVQKGSGLRTAFNRELSELFSDGTLESIIKKWTGQDNSAKIPYVQSGNGMKGVIRAVVNTGYEPMCYKDENGDILGIDPEIILTVADSLGYRVEFIEEDFDMIVPFVSLNKADIGASGISITDDRLELVDFTDPYYDCGAVFISRNDESDSDFISTLKKGFRDTFIEPERRESVIRGLDVTLKVLLISFSIGNILGFLLFLIYFGGNVNANRVIDAVSQILILTPTSTALFIMFYIVFGRSSASSDMVASVALGILFANWCFIDMRSCVSEFTESETKAAYSMGYTRYQILFRLILPRAMRDYCSAMKTETIILVRDTSLIGMISATDISMVFDAIRAETMEPFVPIIFTALTYIVLAFIAGKAVGCIGIGFDYRKRTPEQIRRDILKGSDRT